MAETIIDGTGKGFEAKVDKNGRIHTLSVSEGFNVESAIIGKNYNLNTGSISLTSANESAVAYIKNNEDENFIIEKILVILGESTGGTGDLVVELIRNPSTGTIIDNATNFSIEGNRNFGSVREFDSLTYKGLEGYTLTNGTLFADTTRSSAGTVVAFDSDVIILPKGASICVNITPQTSNTSMSVKVAIIGFLF